MKAMFGMVRASLNTEEFDDDDMKREERALKLAKESYKTMMQNSKLGDVLIIERSYVLLGTKPNDHSMLFSALQKLIEKEDQVSVISLYYMSNISF